MTAYRESARERARVGDLMALVPSDLGNALDIGARDGFLSALMTERARTVTALDLALPQFQLDRVLCVQGDVTKLPFADGEFDLVLCAEVLEHIAALEVACNELGRVSRRYLLVGVPYRQDLRLGRTTCSHCGTKNPPWGHVNSFDEHRLAGLFPAYRVIKTSFVESTRAATNSLACALMDYAGNPYGTYEQDEPCIECGLQIGSPPRRNLLQIAATKAALQLQKWQTAVTRPHGNWLHMLFERRDFPAS